MKKQARDIIKLYERHASAFVQKRSQSLFEKPHLDRFLAHVPEAGHVLDLGCGFGDPIAQYLLDQSRDVTGVDTSAALISIARKTLPTAKWIINDMRTLDLQQTFEGIQVAFTPTRHFSGRGLTDRAKSLWGGWVFKTSNESLYFSGDGGFGGHFVTVGERLGPFDFGWMECGQYNENWHQIHMYPEESVWAAIQSHTGKAMPVHWAGFTLALHSWTDPVERFVAEAEKKELPILYPRIGELVDYGTVAATKWWREM